MTVVGVVDVRIDASFKNIPEILGLCGLTTNRFREEHIQEPSSKTAFQCH